MSKKTKTIIIIAVSILLTATLYFTILHPRIKTYIAMVCVYEEMGGSRDIGLPAEEYNQYSITDDSLIMTDFGAFSIGIPSDLEDQTKEDSDIIVYRTIGAVTEPGVNNPDIEFIGISPDGDDNSGMVIINKELIGSDAELNRLAKGYEALGYGMPDNFYNTLRCAHSLSPDDYSFWNYNKGLAYTYLLPFRAGSPFYSNGDNCKTYFYETEDVCGIICEQYREDYDGNYRFQCDFYSTDDLNTGYIISITVHDKETGYAIINSLTFED